MIIYILFFSIICIMLILAPILSKDIFPFSHYPMFSARHSLPNVIIYRIALEKESGEIEWWEHQAYRYPEFLGRMLLACSNQATSNDELSQLAAKIKKRKLLTQTANLIMMQNNGIVFYKALHIVERRINLEMCITDKTVEIIPFNKILHERAF